MTSSWYYDIGFKYSNCFQFRITSFKLIWQLSDSTPVHLVRTWRSLQVQDTIFRAGILLDWGKYLSRSRHRVPCDPSYWQFVRPVKSNHDSNVVEVLILTSWRKSGGKLKSDLKLKGNFFYISYYQLYGMHFRFRCLVAQMAGFANEFSMFDTKFTLHWINSEKNPEKPKPF